MLNPTKNINNTFAENFIVAFTVYEIFLSYFTNFSFWFGGAFANFFGGRFAFLLLFVYWFSFVFVSSKYPSIAPKKNSSTALIYVSILLLTWLLTLLNSGIAANSLIVWAFNGFVIISMNDKLKVRCFDLFARILAIMLIPAMIEYAVYELTGFGIMTAQGIQRGTYDVYLDQFLFNFINTNYPIQRFQFLTEEPGLVGTCCAFMLFALKGKPQYRFQYIVYLIAGLLTFSFAYYILLGLHVLTAGFKFRYLFVFVIVGAVFYYYFKDSVDALIYTRIEAKADMDDMLGRNSYELDVAVRKAWKDGSILFGHAEQVGEGNAGYKVWLWQYGLLSLFMLFFFYLNYFKKKIKEYKSELLPCLVFFVAFWISFYQRQNITFLDYMVIILVVPIINGTNNVAVIKTNPVAS